LARRYQLHSRAAVGRGYWITSRDICNRVAQLTKKEATLFVIPLKNLKVKITTHAATENFFNFKLIIS
jgi:hypothetical protein